MKINLTENDSDRLADILWWIKGFRAAAVANDDTEENCPFGPEHEETIRRVRLALEEIIAEQKEEGKCRE